jgi:hypothetical protein
MRRILISITLFGLAAAAAPGQPVEKVKPFVRIVEIHPGLPPFEVRVSPLEPPAGSPSLWIEPHPVGRVEIYRKGRSEPLQTFQVSGYGTPFYLQFSRFEDANFDGYADLLIGNDGGAKWGGYDIYLYDPVSGSFVQSELSREMSEHLRGNGLLFHRGTGEIEVDRLVFGCQENDPVTETFVLARDHLRRIGQEDLVRGKEGCYRVTRQVLPGGAMAEISRVRAPEYDDEE